MFLSIIMRLGSVYTLGCYTNALCRARRGPPPLGAERPRSEDCTFCKTPPFRVFRGLTCRQYCYLYEILYVLVGVALKIALGMFYLRIAIERWQILVIKAIVFGTAIFSVACLCLVIFQCIPGTRVFQFSTCLDIELLKITRAQCLRFGRSIPPMIVAFL